MSARDAESGSSTYKGGSRSAGGLGNGGIGGGMGGGGNWGGGFGGGAGRNGGIGNRTGLTTGNKMNGIAGRNGLTFSGRPGGFAREPGAWNITPAAPIGTGPLSGVRRPGAAAVPAAVPGVNPVPEYAPPAWSPPYTQMPPMYDVQPGVPPLSPTTPTVQPAPVAQYPYTFGPRKPQFGSYYTNPVYGDSGPPRYDLGYGFGTSYANSIVNSPGMGYGAAGSIGSYSGR